ncbi:MAG: hypothetical protein JNM18_16130 [Planctomycetaceae bacterium]|nr:hypothetical protein [Planctomycetaceae bacterium]
MQSNYLFEQRKFFELNPESAELESKRNFWRDWLSTSPRKRAPWSSSVVRNGNGPISTLFHDFFVSVDVETCELYFVSIHPGSTTLVSAGCPDEIALPEGMFLLNDDHSDSPRLWEPKKARLSKPFHPHEVTHYTQSSSSLIVWATDRQVLLTDFATQETQVIFSANEPFKRVFSPSPGYLVWLDHTHQAYCWNPRFDRVVLAPELLEFVDSWGGRVAKCRTVAALVPSKSDLYWDLDDNLLKQKEELPTSNEVWEYFAKSIDWSARLEGEPLGRIWKDNLDVAAESWPQAFQEAFLQGLTFGCSCIAFGKDGTLVWGDSEGNVSRVALESDRLPHVIQKNEQCVQEVFLDRNGDVIAWCDQMLISRWDATNRQSESLAERFISQHNFRIGRGPESTLFCYYDCPASGGSIEMLTWTDDPNERWTSYQPLGSWAALLGTNSFRRFANGLIVLGNWHGRVEVYKKKEKHDPGEDPCDRCCSFLAHRDTVGHLAETPDGRLITGSLDGQVKVWDHAFRTAVALSDHDSPIVGMGVLPDGRIVSGSTRGRVVIWDAATDEKDIYDLPGQMTCFASRPNEFQIACGMKNQIIVFALRRK